MSCGQLEHDPGHRNWHACPGLAGGLTCHCSLPVQASEPARVPSPPARVPRPVRRRRADCDWPGQRPPTPSYWHAGVGVWPGLGPGVGSGPGFRVPILARVRLELAEAPVQDPWRSGAVAASLAAAAASLKAVRV